MNHDSVPPTHADATFEPDEVEANARAHVEQEVQQKEEARATVRIAGRVERGPTGTVKMRAPLAVPALPDPAAQRAARIRSMVVVGVMVLCALDAAWVAFRPAPSRVPAHTSDPAYSLPAATPQPAPTPPPDTEPANGLSSAAASPLAPSPAVPTATHFDKRRRPTPPPSTVF
jgi:hypothetical protein